MRHGLVKSPQQREGTQSLPIGQSYLDRPLLRPEPGSWSNTQIAKATISSAIDTPRWSGNVTTTH